MPDATTVLASTQEREKWRQRVHLLEATLTELRAKRVALERRLSRVKRDLVRVTQLTQAARTAVAPASQREVMRGRPPSAFP